MTSGTYMHPDDVCIERWRMAVGLVDGRPRAQAKYVAENGHIRHYYLISAAEILHRLALS
eukprot:6184066-Pleurochrysis_carterae.AAC.2